MEFKKISEYLNGVLVIMPEVYEDERGFFMEVYREDQFKKMGITDQFKQENHSGSIKNVLRGLHFQWEPPMGKMMRVTSGEAFLVAVDIRKNSSTLGRWFGETVSSKNRKQVWAPAGFARGFCVLSDFAEIQYLSTGVYNSKAESGIQWNDPEIGIKWPIQNPILSAKDIQAQTLHEWLAKSESNYFKIQT